MSDGASGKAGGKGKAGAKGRGGPRVTSASFLASVNGPEGFSPGPPEIALVGRSNVGKSSLLNALTSRRGLARTSKTPGRTQHANLFDIEMSDRTRIRLVDLPGYGHANAPRHVRERFGPLIENWLTSSDRLALVLLLLDCRRKPEQAAMNFLLWLEQHSIRTEVVFTKVDKLPRNRLDNELRKLSRTYGLAGRPFATSSQDGAGLPRLRGRMVAAAREFGA